jgi:hypothetical protein
MKFDWTFLSTSKKFSFFFFIGAFLFTSLFYYTGHNAILMDDAIWWGIYEVKTQGLQGYLHSYGATAFYYGHYLFILLLYGFFGMNQLAWFIAFCLLHAANVTLLFQFFNKLFQSFFKLKNGLQIAFWGAVLFLVSSYQSENIIWGATSHYAISLFLFLQIGINLLHYVDTGKLEKRVYLNWAFYAYALVTLEISFLFPFLYLILFICLHFVGYKKVSWKKYFIHILIPQILLIGAYIVCYWIKTGHLLPPDRGNGEPVTLLHQFNTLVQGIVKVFSFINYVDFHKREYVYYLCTKLQYTIPIGILLYSLMGYQLFKLNKQILLLYFFMSLGVLVFSLPFIRLDFVYLIRMETDRYAYFPSVFLFPLFIFLIYQLKSWLRNCLIVSYISCFIFFGWQNVMARNMSGKLNHQFLTTFPTDKKSNVYLLNIPVYCADAYMYRAKNRLDIALFCKRGYIPENVTQVAWYNAQSDKDSFEVKKINDSSWHVQLKTNGSWWWYESRGAGNYSNDIYSFEVDAWGGYIITFKSKLKPNDNVLLFNSQKFLKIN